VVAAGEAEIIVNGDERLCIDITRLSGHYQPDERSLDIGVQAFKTSGITFVNEPREYGDGGEDPCHFECVEEYDGGEYDGDGNIDAREELMRLMRMWESRETAEQDELEDMRQYDGSEYDSGYSEVNNDIDDSNAIAQEGPIKWVVLERSQLLTDPSLVANTVLTASEAVIAAGDYIDVVDGNERFCIEVAADSGNSHIEVTQEPEVREVTDGNDGDHDGDDEPSSNRNEAIDESDRDRDRDRDREKGIFAKLQEEVMGMWQMLASRKRAGDEGTSQGSGVQVEHVQGDSQAQLPEVEVWHETEEGEVGNGGAHDDGHGDGNGGGDGGNHVVHDGYDNSSDEDDNNGKDASRLLGLLPANYRDSWYTSGNFQQWSDNFGGTSGTTYADIASWGTSGNQQQWSEVSITSGTNYGDSHQEPTDSTTNQAELEKASKETRIYKELDDRKCL
jgi:hypothetical protein